MGRLLRDLHAAPPPASAPVLRWASYAWVRLTRTELQFAAGLAERLQDHSDEPLVLLHGDLVPSNIDPVGLRGARAWDLATLHVVTIGRIEFLRHLEPWLDDLIAAVQLTASRVLH